MCTHAHIIFQVLILQTVSSLHRSICHTQPEPPKTSGKGERTEGVYNYRNAKTHDCQTTYLMLLFLQSAVDFLLSICLCLFAFISPNIIHTSPQRLHLLPNTLTTPTTAALMPILLASLLLLLLIRQPPDLLQLTHIQIASTQDNPHPPTLLPKHSI